MTMTNDLPRYAIPMPTWLLTRRPIHGRQSALWRAVAYVVEEEDLTPSGSWERDRVEWVRVAEGFR